MLDSSTFINACRIDQVRLLVLLKSPLCFPEYVFKVELGSGARAVTREAAMQCVAAGQVSLRSLSLADLERIAQLKAPRRIGLGEIACAIIANRDNGAVLSDDWKCRNWVRDNIAPIEWQGIEDVLLEGASRLHLSEFDLENLQKRLEENKYHCRFDLKNEHLMRALGRNTGGQ